MKCAVVAILCSSIAGCTLPTPAAVTPQEPVAIAPTAALIARPGEQMTYKVGIHNLEVAELVVSLGQPAKLDGEDVIVVQTHATSAKLLSLVRPVDDILTSWVDRATGQPVAFKSRELASRNDGDIEESEARFAPGSFPVRVMRGGQVSDEQQVVRAVAYDVPSMLTFLRGWDGEPGAQVSVDVMRSVHAWRVNVVIAAFDNLTTALGDLPVVRYDGDAVRLQRDGTIDPRSKHRAFSIWITDDADRVPAKMVAHTDYGDIEVELLGYRAE